MYILSQDEREIVDVEKVQRFRINIEADVKMIVASFGQESKICILGRYKSMDEARMVLRDLFIGLKNRENVFEMPLSEAVAPEHYVKDARRRRKGGS